MKPQKRTPFQQIQQVFLEDKIIPKEFIPLLPKGWKRIGEVGILELKSKLHPWKKEIGAIYLDNIPELRTIALKVGITTESIRTPNYEILVGDQNTITLHKELGCKFWVDALSLTFSSGNHAERLLMSTITRKNEKIVDMFACVGNLSIPMAVHNPSAQLIGIEINPYAYNFLQQNINENDLIDRYRPILGDNRKVSPKDWADRILMGYFGIDEIQLITALKCLNQKKGGIIHAHGLSSSRKPNDWERSIEKLLDMSFQHFQIKSNNKRIVKTVAAGINHFVNDLIIELS